MQVSILIRDQLVERAKDFFIILDDVSIVSRSICMSCMIDMLYVHRQTLALGENILLQWRPSKLVSFAGWSSLMRFLCDMCSSARGTASSVHCREGKTREAREGGESGRRS